MILQQGYVLVEEELNGVSTGRYIRVYVLVIPFCGILSLQQQPSDNSMDLNKLIESHHNTGWICGGSIFPVSLIARGTVESGAVEGGLLYPLNLTVISDECTCEIHFFFESEETRSSWKQAIDQLFATLLFLKACVDRDFIAVPTLYQAVNHASKNHELTIHQCHLPHKAVPIIKHYLKAQELLLLRKIELCDAQLTDQHTNALNSLLQLCALNLEELSLAQNLLSSKSMKTLCSSLGKCIKLRILDLSSNVISDSSSAALSEALVQLINLKRFSISKNRLSFHSAKSLIARFGNYNSGVEEIDFSYNDLGDDIGFMVAFLLQNVPSVLKSANIACCGLTESSISEIAKHIPSCASLSFLNLHGCSISAETSRNLVKSVSQHHSKYFKNPTRLLLKYGGVSVTQERSLFSLSCQSLRASCFELTDLTVFQQIVLRKLRRVEKEASFCCFRIESQIWWRNSWTTFLAILRNRLRDLQSDHLLKKEDCVKTLTHTAFSSSSHQTAYLFVSINDEAATNEILMGMNSSDPLLRGLNVKSVLLQGPTSEKCDVKTENKLILNAGFCGNGWSDHYVPPVAPVDQFHPVIMRDDEDQSLDDNAFDSLLWTTDLPTVDDDIADVEERDFEKSPGNLEKEGSTPFEEDIPHLKDYQSMLDYENSIRERRLVNERLILAVRRLYQSKEVSSSVAKFWEGMLGNKKYRGYAEKELVLAMRYGHDKITDNSALELGLSHLFPSVARREQLYQAMFSRDIDEILRLQTTLEPSTGGYAIVYANRLTAEIVSLRQQFHSIQLLAKTYAELPLIEEFLLNCGKLSYTGKEMFEAVELRQKLFAHGMYKGGQSFSEMVGVIKARSMMTNLLISRDLVNLRETLIEWRETGSFDGSSLPEISVVENLLFEYDQAILNLLSANEKKDIELIDLALSIAAYWNFFSKDVENCLAVLNDVSRNPAHLMRPIVEGLRKSKMSQVDKGFENLLKMGLVHDALDSVVCSKIHAIKSRIIQDDSVKDKLVKVCLALKNGFHVSPGEIMQLYRNANALKLYQDPSLKSYFKILQKHSKKFTSLQKQEKVIQQLIQDNDVYKLSKLLAGRGMGKLIMSFPTSFARDQWLSKFSFVSTGKAVGDNLDVLESEDFKEDVIFQGTFEKAARSEDGKLRGWRKRFFLLKSVHLFYYTKANGEKKGSIRVLNGGVRIMDVHETNGKLFCLELEEGRDLSCVSPDLLDEARRHVRFAKIMEIESSLRKGISLKSVSLLSKMLKFAEELEVMLDYHLMSEAKHCLQSLQVRQLRRDLYFASMTIPRSQTLQELSNLANTFLLDPNLASLKKVRLLLSKPEIEQEIYRCKSSLLQSKSDEFLKSMKVLSKIDFTQASIKLKSLYITLLMQFIGLRLSDLVLAGMVTFSLMKYLKQSLVLCHVYHVELEVMDLIRFIMKLITRYIPDIGSPLAVSSVTATGSAVSTSSNNIPSDMQGLLDELYHFPKILPQFTISKFPLLRLSSVQHQSGIFGGFQRRRSSVMDEVMSHSTSSIVKSLLKYEVNPIDNTIAVECFELLKCLMGDSSLSGFKKWKKSKILQSLPSHESMMYDLLHLLLVRYPVMQDEIYFQLCKQLRMNPSASSRLHGCWLLSIFLHAFVPSPDAFPYIKNQILQLLVEFSVKTLNSGHDQSQHLSTLDPSIAILPCLSLLCEPVSADAVSVQDDQEFAEFYSNQLCRDVCQYCYWLISQAEFYQYGSSSSYLSSTSLLLQGAITTNPEPEKVQRIFQHILANQRFTFHVLLLTGKVVTLSLHYSQLTYQSLLIRLYDALVPKSLRKYYRKSSQRIHDTADLGSHLELLNEYEGSDAQEKLSRFTALTNPQENEVLDGIVAEELWRDILRTFDGFGFFRLTEAEFVDADLAQSVHQVLDLVSIPIQPTFEQFVDWNHDLQWNFLERCASESESSHLLNGESMTLRTENTVVLRRFVLSSIELFADSEYEIFGCEISETDQIERCNHWKLWLKGSYSPLASTMTSDGPPAEDTTSNVIVSDGILPRDFLRVDLLFSEDTRYVNSRLALMNSDSFHYLLALQLALAWCDAELSDKPIFVTHNSASVASCYCYTSIEKVIEEAVQVEAEMSAAQANAGASLTQNKIIEEEVLGSESDTDEDDALAAIDHPHRYLNPLRSIKSPRDIIDEDEGSSEYVSSIEDMSVDQEIWKPKPVVVGEEMFDEAKAHLQSLLQELGIDNGVKDEESAQSSAVDENHLWQMIGQFHNIATELGISVSSAKYRYYLKRAYHHYLVAITGLFYEQYLINATLVTLELEDGIRNEQIEFQEKYINNFNSLEVLIGLSVQGIYLFNPSDWSIIFYSPFWDITEYELVSSSASNEGKKRQNVNNLPTSGGAQKRLILNVNGLKLVLSGEKVSDVLEVMNIYSKETLKKGSFPFGTRARVDELLTINSYNDHQYPQAKVNSASSFSSLSSSLAQNNNNILGSYLFQLFLANYSLLPVPPMIDNQAFLRNKNFFVAPPSQREIVASTRYEEEKLEEEIMKLAEQILLEKNQQQITKGRNEIMHRNLVEEDDDIDEDNIQDSSNSNDKDKQSAHNQNRSVKLKRKNRSVFQGNRLKSNEEINQILQKDRLDAAVCGVFNKDSVYSQQFQVPILPFRIKGKVKIPSTNGINDSLNENQQLYSGLPTTSGSMAHLKEFQKKPVIQSERFPFSLSGADTGTLSLVWSGGNNNSDPSISMTAQRHGSNNATQSPKQNQTISIRTELEELWKGSQKDHARVLTAEEKGSQVWDVASNALSPVVRDETATEFEDTYSIGLSTSLWLRYRKVKSTLLPFAQIPIEETTVDLSQLDLSRTELDI